MNQSVRVYFSLTAILLQGGLRRNVVSDQPCFRPQFKEIGIKTEIPPESLDFQVVRVYFVVSFLLKLDNWWARRSKGTNGIGLDILFRMKLRVIEINRAFSFPCINNRASQWWRSLLSTWFIAPIRARRRWHTPSTPTPLFLPFVKHMWCDTADDLTMCWLEISDCIRCRGVYFNSCLRRRAYPNNGVSRLFNVNLSDAIIRWIPFLQHPFDKRSLRRYGPREGENRNWANVRRC